MTGVSDDRLAEWRALHFALRTYEVTGKHPEPRLLAGRAADALDEAAVEVERLRAEVAEFKAAEVHAVQQRDNLRAEVERLRADNESLNVNLDAWERRATLAEAALDRVRALRDKWKARPPVLWVDLVTDLDAALGDVGTEAQT